MTKLIRSWRLDVKDAGSNPPTAVQLFMAADPFLKNDLHCYPINIGSNKR